jgi:hypothetical protein
MKVVYLDNPYRTRFITVSKHYALYLEYSGSWINEAWVSSLISGAPEVKVAEVELEPIGAFTPILYEDHRFAVCTPDVEIENKLARIKFDRYQMILDHVRANYPEAEAVMRMTMFVDQELFVKEVYNEKLSGCGYEKIAREAYNFVALLPKETVDQHRKLEPELCTRCV